MAGIWQVRLHIRIWSVFLLMCLGAVAVAAQPPDNATVVQGVDAAVKARVDNIAGYTVTEHYAVFRNQDETHSVAEMMVKTVYRKESGKTYTILSENGSAFIRKQVLGSLLDNERQINLPGNVANYLIDSANYALKLDPNGQKQLDGHDCLVLQLTPKRSNPYLFKGTIWVDAKDYTIMQIQGTESKSPFFLTSAPEVSRQYTHVSGYPMATHARAVSKSTLLGQTIVKIDYTDYRIDLRPGQ